MTTEDNEENLSWEEMELIYANAQREYAEELLRRQNDG